jgi:hypothetical protein
VSKSGVVNLLSGCQNISSQTCVATVCFAAQPRASSIPILHRLQMTDDLSENFLAAASAMLRALHNDIVTGDRTLESYDAGNLPDKHEVEFHDLPAGSAQEAIVNSLKTLQQVPVFGGDSKTVSELIFHVISIQRPGDHDIYLFRKYSKTKELGRSRGLAAIFSDGSFDQLRDPVFLFDQYVDCICINGSMIVLNKDNYHRIFRFFEMAKDHAQATLDSIRAIIPIDNAVKFEADCKNNPLILVRLRGIADRNYFSKMSFAQLEQKIISDNLPIKISGSDGTKKLVYDPQHKWQFLRLLDDGFLASDMTGHKYEVTGKRARP